MNERVVVVLLLITIVLSITAVAIVFSIPTSLDSGNRVIKIPQSDPDDGASVGLVVQSPVGGTG